MPRYAAPVRPSLARFWQRSLTIVCAIIVATTGDASADDDNEVQAAKHYEQGKAFFRVGEYALCAAEFRSSYQLVNKPGALFNQARCHEEQGDYEAAVASFDGYIAAEPDGAQVAEATARATALRRKLKEAEAVPASPDSTEVPPEVTPEVPEADSVAEASPPDTDPTDDSSADGSQDSRLDTPIAPRPSPTSNTRRVLAISTGAAGIVGLGVATAFALSARTDWQKAQALCADGSPCSSMAGVTLSQDAKGSAQLATVLVGISTVSLAAATYFWFSQPTERNMAVSLAPAATGKGGSVHVGMEF